MRIDFNVLWVDDQPDNIAEDIENLGRLIRKEGFKLRQLNVVSVAEAKAQISDEVFKDHIDLILMDYHLEGGPNGDQGLVELRKEVPFKDIIFYSAAADQLLDLVKAANVEGIFCSSRRDLSIRAFELFRTLIKKVVDIEHTRGIVMGATSDIDHYVNDCLCLLLDDAEKYNVLARKIVEGRLDEIKLRLDEKMDRVRNAEKIETILENHEIYTSIDRFNLLRKIIKAVGLNFSGIDKLKEYVSTSDISRLRNILAHVRVKVEGFKRTLIAKSGEELTSDQMRDLRLALVDHHENLEALYALLSPPALQSGGGKPTV